SELIHVADDRASICRPAHRRLDPVDSEPAVLVDQDADEVHVPRGERPERGGAVRPVEDPPTLNARVFGARPVDPLEDERLAGAAEESVAGDVETRGRLGPGRRDVEPYCQE